MILQIMLCGNVHTGRVGWDDFANNAVVMYIVHIGRVGWDDFTNNAVVMNITLECSKYLY